MALCFSKVLFKLKLKKKKKENRLTQIGTWNPNLKLCYGVRGGGGGGEQVPPCSKACFPAFVLPLFLAFDGGQSQACRGCRVRSHDPLSPSVQLRTQFSASSRMSRRSSYYVAHTCLCSVVLKRWWSLSSQLSRKLIKSKTCFLLVLNSL